jgi:hypothetical protein
MLFKIQIYMCVFKVYFFYMYTLRVEKTLLLYSICIYMLFLDIFL